MRASYQIDYEDLLEAQKAGRRLFWLVIAPSMGAFFLLGSHFLMGQSWRSASISGVVFGLVSAVLMPPFMQKALRKQYETDPSFQERQELAWSDDGIKVSGPSSVRQLAWSEIRRWRETERLIIVMKLAQPGLIIPKRGFFSPDDLAELKRRLSDAA